MQQDAGGSRLRAGGGLVVRGVVDLPGGPNRAPSVLAVALALVAGAGAGYWLGNVAGERRAAAEAVSRAELRALLERIEGSERLREALHGILNSEDVSHRDGAAPVPWTGGGGR